MNQIITEPALRIKVTGVCNRTCSFCNEEGDMRNIESVEPDTLFFECVHTLTEKLRLKKIMITGEEPLVHSKLHNIINGISVPEISVTTNGIRSLSIKEWSRLRESGLQKVVISIHDATPQSLIQLETRQRHFGWAICALESQKHNLTMASEAGLYVRVNTVAYGSSEQTCQVLDFLSDLQRKYNFDIRILNDLANTGRSQKIIKDLCQMLGAKIIKEERRAGSSNATTLWESESGFRFSTKIACQYFFDDICTECEIKEQCHEGFYGIRLEKRMSDYWVRLCLYKQTPNVLIPWRKFLQSELSDKFKNICEREQS